MLQDELNTRAEKVREAEEYIQEAYIEIDQLMQRIEEEKRLGRELTAKRTAVAHFCDSVPPRLDACTDLLHD